MKQKAYLFFLTVLFISQQSNAQEGLFLGGGLSAHLPSDGFKPDNFGFNDVANVGGGASIGTLWFFNPILSLGSEFGYSYFLKDKTTWNQEQRGEINVNYQSFNLSAQGNFYLNEEEVRPYLGVSFGLYYLRNMLNFDSNYVGSTNDASVSYISKTFHAGFGPEIGVLFETGKKEMLMLSTRYTIIPNITAEYHPEDQVTTNPHGKQNHWSISLKYFWDK